MTVSLARVLAASGCVALALAMLLGEQAYALLLAGAVAAGVGSALIVSDLAAPPRRHG